MQENIKNKLREIVQLLKEIINELDFDSDYEKRIKLIGISAEMESLIKRWNELKTGKELDKINETFKRFKEFEKRWG